MRISFYLLHRADDVSVYVVEADNPGVVVDTLASDRHMTINRRSAFIWNGRTSSGGFAPDGTYAIRVSLKHQGRTLLISNHAANVTVLVQRHAPALRVTNVTPSIVPAASAVAATATFTGAGRRRPRVLIYRTDVPGKPVLVKSYNATTRRGRTVWNGTLTGGTPAPQGTYLVGLRLRDRACNAARFPASLPPVPGSTGHAGVTVRYLAAQPPMTPVRAGTSALVDVDARRHRYFWTLRQAGGAGKAVHSGSSSTVTLRVPLPGVGPALYELGLRWGDHRTTVPIVADAAAGSAAARAKVLVVLPTLTWQGLNAVDDDYDGIPNTLSRGLPIRLQRPLVHGLPQGFADEAALVDHLRTAGLAFDLTTDIALIQSGLPGKRHGIVFAGAERWLPEPVGEELSRYVQQGGHVLSLGIDSMRRSVNVTDGQALDPGAPQAIDYLLARPGKLVAARGALILAGKDRLHIFAGTSGALSGFASYQPIASVSPPAAIVSEAGASNAEPSIVGYRLGRGDVVDIGLPGFALSLAHNIDARELLSAVWKVLQR
jgi:hypothetical protein